MPLIFRHSKIVTGLISILLTGLIGFLVASCDQPVERKEFVVGILNPNPHTPEIVQGFVEGLQKYSPRGGYAVTVIEGECPAGCDIKDALQELLARKVDLLFTVTTPAAGYAKELTQASGTPVIFLMQDPVKSGIARSLSRPGGHMTGIQVRGSVAKALEWLRVVSPGLRKIYVPVRFDTKAARQGLADLKEAAAFFGIEVVVAEVNTEEESVAALAAMPGDVDGIFVVRSLLVDAYIDKIVSAGIARGLPMASSTGKYNEGLTLSFGLDRYRAGRQASRLAHMVLMGENPGDIPVELVDFYLNINLRTARASGVEIPQEVLLQAHDIIR